jgi:hypothetical protein
MGIHAPQVVEPTNLGVMVGWVTWIGYVSEIRQLLHVRAVRRLPRGTPVGVFAVFFRVARRLYEVLRLRVPETEQTPRLQVA